jgi:hypothetical protein
MLAYAFWHWPEASAGGYEEKIAAFQSALASHPPQGFQRGFTLRHPAAPWLPGEAYLDWYAIGGFADLETLNQGAITSARKAPHDAVAAQARSGAGGVYGHVGGGEDLASARVAHWFGKPRGISYDDFLRPLKALPGSVWMRQMVLGPSPEFVVFADRELTLHVAAQSFPVTPVWPRKR